MKVGQDGKLNKELINSHTSESGNFAALKQVVNDTRTFEVAVVDKYEYKTETGAIKTVEFGEVTQGEPRPNSLTIRTGEEGNLGVTQTPGSDPNKFNSVDDKIRININSGLSELGQAEIMSHEGYGHADLYSKGLPHSHKVISTENGFKESNKALAEQLNKRISETDKNYAERKKNSN